jgi:hypothetical protein
MLLDRDTVFRWEDRMIVSTMNELPGWTQAAGREVFGD